MKYLKHLFSFALGVLLGLFRALALKLTWGWFVVPIFNLPQISLIVSLGLMYVFYFCQGLSIQDATFYESQGPEELIPVNLKYFAYYGLSLGFAYIFHLFL